MTLDEALRIQARACTGLGSPFMGRLLGGLADHWPADLPVARALTGWTGDIGPGGASLPLRLAGGLHALVLSGRDPALAAQYPPNDTTDTALIGAAHDAMARHKDFLRDWLASPPQTNEVRRSVALIPAAHWIARRHPLPLMTSELGASAGLNLIWDRFALTAGDTRYGPPGAPVALAPDWTGPAPAPQPVTVAARAGVDLNPLDLRDDRQRLRVFSYLWPDQPDRMALTRAAIGLQDCPVETGDAIDWLARRLEDQPDGRTHLIYHTVAWQYFPPEAQARGTRLIEDAGTRATPDRPLAWLGMENDGDNIGAALTLRLWPGDLRVALARVDFHGRWVRWNNA